MNAGLERRLERIEASLDARGPDLAMLLREALEAHGREAVDAVCQRVGITLERAERWAAEKMATTSGIRANRTYDPPKSM